jgi:hypothetical protein
LWAAAARRLATRFGMALILLAAAERASR